MSEIDYRITVGAVVFAAFLLLLWVVFGDDCDE